MMSLHESKAAEGQAMYTKVMRDQFEIKDGAMIHTDGGGIHSGDRDTRFNTHLDGRYWRHFAHWRVVSIRRCLRSHEDDLAAGTAASVNR